MPFAGFFSNILDFLLMIVYRIGYLFGIAAHGPSIENQPEPEIWKKCAMIVFDKILSCRYAPAYSEGLNFIKQQLINGTIRNTAEFRTETMNIFNTPTDRNDVDPVHAAQEMREETREALYILDEALKDGPLTMMTRNKKRTMNAGL